MVSNKNSNGQVTTENGHFYFHFHFIQQIYSFEILVLISFSSLLYKPYASLKRLKFLKNIFEITNVKNVANVKCHCIQFRVNQNFVMLQYHYVCWYLHKRKQQKIPHHRFTYTIEIHCLWWQTIIFIISCAYVEV